MITAKQLSNMNKEELKEVLHQNLIGNIKFIQMGEDELWAITTEQKIFTDETNTQQTKCFKINPDIQWDKNEIQTMDTNEIDYQWYASMIQFGEPR